ncbi:oligosaccharide flippase family protein [Gelidibacter salicanalis]|uniref:Oligosaccharide flippase family protein n=1 Tax=Gelidibacter salicanalis TaxID=291193 RepID=A0A5C7AQ71_9FLAO|nr:polysaccharide biosynthesis C-terminal domain-containing protein [Gelidibacter salicanalis]TXE10906.1 oligosaccharide flippase family protein [Gelidibacter salicanalis]
MGIVTSQSFKNTITTYLGFAIGALNTLYLYVFFISDMHYGLISFMLSTATIMMPLMAFGVHNTMVKFYSTFKTKNSLNSFLTLMLFLPLALILPTGLIGVIAYDNISNFLAQKNPIIGDYVWYIYVAAIVMAYFEVFFAWTKTQMQTVFGNFLKEVFHRLGIMLLLFCVYLEWLTVDAFIIGVIAVYALRMLIMMFYAFSVRLPVFKFHRIDRLSPILKYTVLIIIAGSIATVILDVDSFMLGMYISIEKVAYYGVAIYIATVIVVPSRSMQQILQPLTAKYLNEKNKVALEDLYVRSSQTLFIIGGLIFLLIVLNINSLYETIPSQFSGGLIVVFLVSLAKLYDCLMGCNNVILFNSDYYRVVLLFGVILTILTVVLNMLFIPKFGINGAAFATFIAVTVYNSIKIYFVKLKFNMMPFNTDTGKVLALLIVMVAVFYFWEFPFHPLVNIGLKSVVITVLYVAIVFKLNVSDDISRLIRKYLRFQ